MAQPGNNRTEPQSQSLGSYLLPMLLSAAVGAGVMWVIMSQRTPSVQRPPIAQTQTAPPTNPSNLSPADAAVVRGNHAYDHQQWADAIREYQDALAKGVDNPDVRTDLGNAFRFSDEPEKALEQYTIAQMQDPMHENSLFNQIGLFVEVMNDPIRAIPVCEEFIKRFPRSEKVSRVQEQLNVLKNL